jgi:hypothetical protein
VVSRIWCCLAGGTDSADKLLMHRRFGHQSVFSIEGVFCETCKLARQRKKGISEHGKVKYVSCNRILHTLLMDLQGPFSFVIAGKTARLPSVGAYLYTFPVMDEYSRFVWMTLLRTKDEAAGKLIELMKKLKNQFSETPIVRVHSDGGREFINQQVIAYLNSVGIEQTYTTRNKPAHNGKVERFNQTMNRIARSFMVESNCPFRLWSYCVNYATYVYNRTPLAAIDGVSPYEKLYGVKPKVKWIVPFGCDAYYALNDKKRGKLQALSGRAVFVGVSEQQNAVMLLTVHDAKVMGRMVITRDVTFNEQSYKHMAIYARWLGHSSGTAEPNVISDIDDGDALSCNVSSDVDQDDNVSESESESDKESDSVDDDVPAPDPIIQSIIQLDGDNGSVNMDDESNDNSGQIGIDSGGVSVPQIANHGVNVSQSVVNRDSNAVSSDDNAILTSTRTRSGRVSRPVDRGPMLSDFSVYAVLQAFCPIPEPVTYKQAMQSVDRERWMEAMNAELLAMEQLKVFELVKREPQMYVVKSGWVYKVKYNERNEPERYKARLVAKGYSQQYGVNLFETNSPVSAIESVRLVIFLAVHYNLQIYQIDVKNAFINATLDSEDIYMEIPDGLFDDKHMNQTYVLW